VCIKEKNKYNSCLIGLFGPQIWMKVPMYFPEEVDDMIDWDLPPVKSSWRMSVFTVACTSHLYY
jgi:hypothetical protein